ncbi:ketoacyl-ACP synthase III [Enterococcus faecium]|uniref:3-oxoacyl-ACP synthase III family protein n=1 Tax=Bacillota TaxID=1239 RepID=UPI000D6F6CAA|nr:MULTISPECIES: ketoacyl-ACP synthase III [Bacillota]MBJ0795876.1 ketoacyl-ACP synthase III [Enterococcus faecium]MCC9822823.1 ketoacyl-ACP synthase III [Streptococcus agalactiae]MCK6315224.1 ketoacyl-ACP synthase III [Streptococcus agalactiae]MDB8850154.1 ketoacyl-ACP synthase III [Peptostreptococcus anaerobius]MDB8854071.1 ketoacyl-ACP synthase III [Peptostreptococcus anaerobius]
MNSRIIGVGRYLPNRVIKTIESERYANFEKFGVKLGLCKMLTGCEERRYSDTEEYSSDIAAKAAKKAIENAHIDKKEIDAVIFCSVSQDFAEPATVNVVMDLLGIKNAYGFDIKNACNAFLSGLDIADSLIKTNKAKYVLVVSGEALSKWVSYDFKDKNDMLNRAPVTFSIGDGGGAIILGETKEEGTGIIKGIFETFPEYWNNNVVWGGGVRFPHSPEKMFIPGTTKVIIDEQRNLGKHLLPLLSSEVGWDFTKDIDYYVPTQVAKWINQSMSKELNFPIEKIVQVVEKYGNVGASNIPIALVEIIESGKLKRGDKILMTGVGVGINIGTIAMVY